jgi:hypothetical protein
MAVVVPGAAAAGEAEAAAVAGAGVAAAAGAGAATACTAVERITQGWAGNLRMLWKVACHSHGLAVHQSHAQDVDDGGGGARSSGGSRGRSSSGRGRSGNGSACAAVERITQDQAGNLRIQKRQ